VIRSIAIFFVASLAASAGPVEEDANPTNRLEAIVAAFESAQRTWSRDGLLRAQPRLEQACRDLPGSATALAWKAANEFHLVLNYLTAPVDDASRKQARVFAKQATATLEQALTLRPDAAECHALLATVTGLRIQDSPAASLWLGPKVMRHKKLALQYGSDNPRVQYLVGTSLYYAPALAGGGRDRALEHLLRARALFEQEQKQPQTPLQPVWGYDNCLSFIGRVYQSTGDRRRAADAFAAALQVNPSNGMALAGVAATR
jgi:tetratricopeptide (TPR) repeat protein